MQSPPGSPGYHFGLLTLSTYIYGYYANKGSGEIRGWFKVQNFCKIFTCLIIGFYLAILLSLLIFKLQNKTNRSSVIVHLIENDCRPFGNLFECRPFDWARLPNVLFSSLEATLLWSARRIATSGKDLLTKRSVVPGEENANVPFSFQEAALFLVSTKNHDLYPRPTTFRF